MQFHAAVRGLVCATDELEIFCYTGDCFLMRIGNDVSRLVVTGVSHLDRGGLGCRKCLLKENWVGTKERLLYTTELEMGFKAEMLNRRDSF